MKKLPYGISNYEELIEDNYYYVDKTKYIEKLENIAEKRIMFLRPRKFGKTLFASTLENYYDINKNKQEELLPILKENYDGYKFSIKSNINIYNSNMCLYFLNEYTKYNELPEKLIDMNIASDYSKLGKMLDLCKSENRIQILENTVSGEEIITDITEKFNPEVEFGDKEFASMLFYLGYLTIDGEELGKPELKIPNKIMREIYSETIF